MSFSLTHASHMDFSVFHYIIFMVIISFKIETSLQELKIKHDYTVIGYRVGSRYCTVCNSFNLSPYFNLKDINMTHHRATSSIRVTPLSPTSSLFSLHPSASSNFKKLSPFLSSIRSFSRTPWLQLAATNSSGGSGKFPMSL